MAPALADNQGGASSFDGGRGGAGSYAASGWGEYGQGGSPTAAGGHWAYELQGMGAVIGGDLFGGNGVNGTAGIANVGGGGGGGGDGIELHSTKAFQFVNESIVTGGAGGDGGQSNVLNGMAGGGGAGGNALNAEFAVGVMITNRSSLTGGDGGNSISGSNDADYALAGAGGAGVVLGDGKLDNVSNASIVGGNSGLSGKVSNFTRRNDGGVGVLMGGGKLTNAGTISGGAGNDAYGVKVTGSGTVISAGSIEGGKNADGIRASAVLMSGTGGRLELRNGYYFGGQVTSTSGDNVLALGGDADSSFNLTSWGTGYVGFSNNIEKTGNSMWELRGQATQAPNWTVKSGTLSFIDGAQFGGFGNTITLGDARLAYSQASGDTTLSAAISMTAAVGTIDVASGSALTITEDVSGTMLKKEGQGLLNLEGKAVYGTLIATEGQVVLENLMLPQRIGSSAEVSIFTHGDQNHRGDIFGLDTGNGMMIKNGIGTLTLLGTNALDWRIVEGGLSAVADRYAGNVDMALGTRFTFASPADGSYRGRLSGTGTFAKRGAGRLDLLGDSSAFTGSTQVEQGTLNLGPAAKLGGGVVVNSGATLSGSGSVASTNTLSGGTLSLVGGGFKVRGDAIFRKGSTLSMHANANSTSGVPLRADLVQLDAGVTFRLSGIYSTSTDEVLLIDTENGINGDFGTISVGGGASTQDYLALHTSKSADNLQYYASYGLAWTAGNSLAQGTFTLAETESEFEVGVNLGDQASNTATGWNGKTLTKEGQGTLVLSGANTFTGGVSFKQGRISVAHEQGLGTGAVDMHDGTTLAVARDGMTLSNALSIDGGNKATINTDAYQATWLGNINGAGELLKQGTGSLVLAGNGSNFAGTTLVDAGSLLLSSTGKLGGNLKVASGAKLAGTGEVGSTGSLTTIQSGATLAGGDGANDYGTLRVLGDLTMESGSSLQVKVKPDSTVNSLVDVAGAANLNGSVLHVGKEVDAAADFQVGQDYTILTAGSIKGTFASSSSNFAYLKTELKYGDTDVKLTLNRNDRAFADLAQTSNQTAVASAVEAMSPSSEMYKYVQGLSKTGAAEAFARLSGDPHANWQSGLQALSAHASGLGAQRMHSNLTAGYRSGAAIAQSNGSLPASAWPTSKAMPAWAEVIGNRQSIAGDGNAAKLTQNVYGLFMGADEEVGSNGWRVGGSLGFTKADAKVKARDASAATKSYSASVYAGKGFSHGMNRVNVIGGLAYTHHRISSERSLPTLGQNLKAKYSAHTMQLFGEVGYAMGQYSKQGVEPFAGINISQQRVGSFQESGGFAALRGQSNNDTTTSTTLGVRAHSDFKLGDKDARVKGTVGWRHAFGDVKQSSTMAFEGSSNFVVTGVPLARNTALLGLQAEVELGRRAALELGYQGKYGSGTRDNTVNVKVRWAY